MFLKRTTERLVSHSLRCVRHFHDVSLLIENAKGHKRTRFRSKQLPPAAEKTASFAFSFAAISIGLNTVHMTIAAASRD